MTFITLDDTVVASGPVAHGFKVYFSPGPAKELFPCVWLDLHLGGESYQVCEDEHDRRQFGKDSTGGFMLVRPHRSVRLTTAERIGVDVNHTAVVVNVASRAKHGLIVAPGKVDPGFNPAPLLLVVHNQSQRSIRLRVGDKIAAIAFAQLSAPALATASAGHASAALGADFEARTSYRVRRWLAGRDWPAIGWDIAKVVLTVTLTLLAASIAYENGWRAK